MIKFNHNTNFFVPIPYTQNGEVNIHLLAYLTARRKFPFLIKHDQSLAKVSETTAKNEGYRISFLLNILDENEINYKKANFNDLEQIILSLHYDYDWKGSSLIEYVSAWRLFYEFLTLQGIHHELHFPPKLKLKKNINMDEDYLSHTRKTGEFTNTLCRETAVPESFCVNKDDYCDSVISMDKFWQLYLHLRRNEDPVYAVMSAVMLQTLLRTGGILQFPVAPSKLNPNWARSSQLRSFGRDSIKLSYVNKGGKLATCQVHRETLKLFEDEYLEPYYSINHARFVNDYCKSKHAKKRGFKPSDKPTWLNENGTPVSSRMLQKAFENASKALNFKVYPHMLRHTGATQLLYRYCKNNGIPVSHAICSDLHIWLRSQLAHASIRTTELYINTIHRIAGGNAFLEIMPSTLPYFEPSEEQLKKMNSDAKDALIRAQSRHETFIFGSTNKVKN